MSLSIFNAAATPIYLASWYAEWADRSANCSLTCVRGDLPFRLQAQDTHMLVVDLGQHGFADLKTIGLVDGSGQYFYAGDTETAIMVQDAERYSVLHQEPDNSELEAQLQSCEVDVRVEIETSAHGTKTLVINFSNRSDVAIPVAGARIEWKYDPPRTQPRGSDATGSVRQVQLIGGSVNLACRTDLSSSVQLGETVQFYAHPDNAGVLVETILGDVKDEDIFITFGTTTRYAWHAKEDEIPSTIREYALDMVDSRRSGYAI